VSKGLQSLENELWSDPRAERDMRELRDAAESPSASAFEQLLEMRDEARRIGHFEINQTILEMIFELEEAEPSLNNSAPSAPPPLCPLEKRRVKEKYFPLLRIQVLNSVVRHSDAHRDLRILIVQAENARKGIMSFVNLNKKADGWSPHQLKLLQIENPADFRRVMDERRMEIFKSLDDAYLKQRVAHCRCWGQILLEGHQQSPWRIDWPANGPQEDIYMSDFVTAASMRYTAFGVVSAAMSHIIEFHMAFLSVCPPEFVMTRWLLKKMKRAMAQEKPEGRRLRPGVTQYQVDTILTTLWEAIQVASSARARLYVNIAAAISLAWNQAVRLGELCRGVKWDQRRHLSRQTVRPVTHFDANGDAECAFIQPPIRKTSLSSDVARDKCNKPWCIDLKDTSASSFAVWGRRLAEIDPCSPADAPTTPAFRLLDGIALSGPQACLVMKQTIQDCIKDWESLNLSGQSLRIGKIGAMQATGMDLERILAISTHTAAAGIAPYTRQEISSMLDLQRRSRSAVVQPVETIVRFDSDRSTRRESTYMVSDKAGNLLPVTQATQLDGLVDSADEDDTSDSDTEPDTTNQKRAKPPTPVNSPVRPDPKRSKAAQTALLSPTLCVCGCGGQATHTPGRGRPRKNQVFCQAQNVWKIPSSGRSIAEMFAASDNSEMLTEAGSASD
jgi:hypothetical protein